jgi:membrane protein implicated in regulation of membrane protease activity
VVGLKNRSAAMPVQPDARRRWFGLFHLIVSAGMLIWGLTLLEPVLRGWLFVGYWLACAGFALLALVTGWLDWRAVRRRMRAERRELMLRTLGEIRDKAPSVDSPATDNDASPPAPPKS